VNTVSTLVDDAPSVLLFGSTVGSGETRLLARNTGPDTCYIGGSDVTAAGGAKPGMPLKLDEVLNLSPARRQDTIYGICGAAGTATIVLLWG
jgi:hypothetical protein